MVGTGDSAGGSRRPIGAGLPSWRAALSGIGLLVLLAVLVPFVLYAVPQLAGADASYVVLSGSMEPTIATGDVVLVESVDPGDVEAGDVVTYERPHSERPTTHRVVGVTETERGPVLRTKGDANEDPDPRPVRGRDLVGRVVLTLPLVGHVIGFAGTPLGIVSFVVVPFGLLAAMEVASMVGSARNAGAATERPGEAGAGDPESHVDATGSEATRPDEDPPPGDAIVVTGTDLRLSVVALAVLAGYSGWNTYRFWTVTGVPDPASAAVCVGAVTAMALALLVRRLVPGPADDTRATAARRPATADVGGGGDEPPRSDPGPPPAPAPSAAPADGDAGPGALESLAVLSSPTPPPEGGSGRTGTGVDGARVVSDGSGAEDEGERG